MRRKPKIDKRSVRVKSSLPQKKPGEKVHKKKKSNEERQARKKKENEPN